LDHDRGVNIHQTTDDQQKQIQDKQEYPTRMDGGCRPLDAACNYVGVNEVICQTERNSHNQQHASNQQAALGHYAAQIVMKIQIVVEDSLGDERVESGQGRCFHGGCDTAE